MSLPIVKIRIIDFKKFLNAGSLIDTLEITEVNKKCYVITNLPDSENIDVKAIVEEASKKAFDESYKVILRLAGSTTKIRTIKNSGQGTYLSVWGTFSLPTHLEIQGQHQIYLVGSINHNLLHGSESHDAVWGGIGKDFLEGKGGNDRLRGGTNRDMIDGGIGDDVLHGDTDDDWLWGKDGNDKLYGGTGDDHLNGGFGDDTLDGGAGDDEMLDGPGNDTLRGGHGNDKFYPDVGHDVFAGGAGNNEYYFTSKNIGRDAIEMDSNSKGVDTINFGSDKQRLLIIRDDKSQKVNFYLFTDSKNKSPLIYNGRNHITVTGYSNDRKLLVKKGKSLADKLVSHTVVYKIKGQQHTFETFLFKGTKEVFLPKSCEFVSLHGPNKRLIEGAVPKTFTDSTKELYKLFDVQ